jgi:hypothetical protein
MIMDMIRGKRVHPITVSWRLYQGNLTEGEGQVQLTSLYYFRLAPFYIEKIISIFNKTSYLIEVNGTEPSPPQLVFPAYTNNKLLWQLSP